MFNNAFIKSVTGKMESKFGKDNSKRIKTGVHQMQKLWQKEDGTVEDFEKFCFKNFIVDKEMMDKSFRRLENAFENINGLLVELKRDLQWNLHVDTGPILAIDYLVANFNLAS
ncbi:MAG: hypothetical protein KAX28_05955, partial [Candidatus Marinimicrobia bacterium]|nr:hypothetical protein [Candidatus Neomarinimicrobiota bacterium]